MVRHAASSHGIGIELVRPSPGSCGAAGEKRTFRFVLAWHFANREHGQAYAMRFADAGAVAGYIFDNHERLTGETRLWRDTFIVECESFNQVRHQDAVYQEARRTLYRQR